MATFEDHRVLPHCEPPGARTRMRGVVEVGGRKTPGYPLLSFFTILANLSILERTLR